MWWTLFSDLLGPMILGALLTSSTYEIVRFYRPRRAAVIRYPVRRTYTRRTPGQASKAA